MPAKVPKVKEKQVEKKVKKEKRKKTNQEKEVLKVKDKLKAKSLPTFRGRFGARFKRRKSNKKWDKWHRPRGIDIVFKNDDGALPKIGYRTPKAIRFLHPSGLNEVIVSNLKELSKVKENVVVRFAAKIGKRKWIEMKKTAKEQKVRVLNRWKKWKRKK